VRCICPGQNGTAGHAGHEDRLRLGGLGPGGGSGARQVPVNPGAIPDVSSAAPAPAAPPATAREVLDVPSYPKEGVQRHIEYLLTPRSRPGQRDLRGGTGLWRQGHLAYLPIRVLTCMSASDGGPGPLPGEVHLSWSERHGRPRQPRTSTQAKWHWL
jgi:hypothetical protein